MKKILIALICAVMLCSSAVFAACGKKQTDCITVYAPDGAPALAIARLMSEEKNFNKNVKYRVVSAEEISSCVTYNDESKNADLCILPVNAASKLLGTGARYKMLGAVTHGNLFILSGKDKPSLTAENFAETVRGAKIGVVNMTAFPGAACKLVLEKYGILRDVMLESVLPAQVSGTETEYDYFVVPEPAASTRVANANLNLKQAGSLQSLYGKDGYPQAVLVAKNSLIEKEGKFIAEFMKEMEGAADWLLDENVSAETIYNAVKSHYADPENTKPAFTAANLTKSVIANCAVRFVDSSQCKERVKTFLDELISVNDVAATKVADGFFYSA